MDGEVRIYCTERKIGDHKYIEHICARSFEEAQEIASKFGATVMGTLEEVQCAKCGNIERGAEKPKLGEDEWPDIVG